MGPSKEKLAQLEQRMAALDIKTKDIEEKFIKASGRGGQKVNKTSCAVFVKHIPTGTAVKCGSERSRHLNRFLALRRLVDQVEAERSGIKEADAKKIDKIKKQKKRRKRKARSKHQ